MTESDTSQNRGTIIIDDEGLRALAKEIPSSYRKYDCTQSHYVDLLMLLAEHGFEILIPDISAFNTTGFLKDFGQLHKRFEKGVFNADSVHRAKVLHGFFDEAAENNPEKMHPTLHIVEAKNSQPTKLYLDKIRDFLEDMSRNAKWIRGEPRSNTPLPGHDTMNWVSNQFCNLRNTRTDYSPCLERDAISALVKEKSRQGKVYLFSQRAMPDGLEAHCKRLTPSQLFAAMENVGLAPYLKMNRIVDTLEKPADLAFTASLAALKADLDKHHVKEENTAAVADAASEEMTGRAKSRIEKFREREQQRLQMQKSKSGSSVLGG